MWDGTSVRYVNADGIISTTFSSGYNARYATPDNAGGVVVSPGDSQRIYYVFRNGTSAVLAGTGSASASLSVGGAATSTALYYPYGVLLSTSYGPFSGMYFTSYHGGYIGAFTISL